MTKYTSRFVEILDIWFKKCDSINKDEYEVLKKAVWFGMEK